MVLALLAWMGFITLAAPAAAQEASPELRARAEQVVALVQGSGNPAEMFTPEFLAQVPETQVRAVAGQLVAQYGAARRVAGIEAQSANAALVHYTFDRAIVHMQIIIQPQAPHRVAGLLVTGADLSSDNLATVIGEIRALPGLTSVAVARLGDGAPELIASIEPDRPLAIGSAFKLFILAELSRQVKAGERRWSDVVALDRRSIPSGVLQSWPPGSPITLHTLAAMMISQSDNTATDVLLHLAGRENVERMMTTASGGGTQPADAVDPRAFRDQDAPDAAVAAWRAADEPPPAAARHEHAAADAARIDLARFTGGPLHIDSVEWFASASDMVRTMDWLRRNGDETARAILAITRVSVPR
jgi:hypothetical protein